MPQNIQQREELHKTIWAIANSLRGAIDGWEFKSYVLCSIFYRFISENMQQYIDHLQELAGVKGFDYSQLDDKIAETVRTQMVQEKGYFILPSQLFCNVCKTARKDENLNLSLQNTFRAIEASAQGTPSEDDVRGLFSDFAVNNSQLGQSVQIRNQKLADVLIAVRDMDLKTDNFEDNEIDTFGDTYEFLMKMYASNAGKSGGEFYTPQEVSELLAELASINNDHIDSVYDPACGSGSLLMKFSKTVGKTNPELKYYGQEINPTTYNLCRINMFLHNINFSNFDIKLGDTLLKPMHKGLKFDAIVSNPPYSIKWISNDNPLLINDDRFAPAGVLAPKSYADLAFVMHMLYHLKETGTCAIVEFPGVLYRTGNEQKIRNYLVANNYVDTIIQLPDNMFFGVDIETCIIVLKKSAKRDSSVLFVDARNECEKIGVRNVMTAKHQKRIIEAVKERKSIDHFCSLVKNDKILENNANLFVTNYVDPEIADTRIDLSAINESIKDVAAALSQYQSKFDAISDIIKSLDFSTVTGNVLPKDVTMMGIGELIKKVSSKARSDKSVNIVYSVTNNRGFVKSDEMHDFRVHSEDTSNYTIVRTDMFAYNPSRLNVGSIALLKDEDGLVSPMYVVFEVDKTKVLPEYLLYLIKTENVRQQINSLVETGARFRFEFTRWKRVMVAIPPLEAQKSIIAFLDKYSDYLEKLKKSFELHEQQYSGLRDSIMKFSKK